MIIGYEIERLKVALEAVEGAASTLARRELPDWLQHRLALIRAEVHSLWDMLPEKLHTHSAGAVGNTSTAQARGSTSTGNSEE